MTAFRSRDFVLASMFVLKVMADLQPYRFEPESVPNPEDRVSECTCERCEIMPTQRECVCCREQSEAENKMEGRILRLYCIGRSGWKNNFLSKLL